MFLAIRELNFGLVIADDTCYLNQFYIFRVKRNHMKSILILLIICSLHSLKAQTNAACENHPLFNKMPQHSISRCEERDFDEMDIRFADKNSYTTGKKSGRYLTVAYVFDGEWEKRPSDAQILQNYIAATTNAGGKVLYKSQSYAYLSLKKSGNQFWVEVLTDGSGTYYVTSIQEAVMKQDIVVSAEQIKKDISTEGKAIFYGIYFDSGKSTIKAESAEAIAEIAKYLTANAAVNVYIVGHTDNTGTHESNMSLSTERARAVVDLLVQKHQISSARLQAAGVGPLAPITTNKTEEGKSKNRRVEMILK